MAHEGFKDGHNSGHKNSRINPHDYGRVRKVKTRINRQLMRVSERSRTRMD